MRPILALLLLATCLSARPSEFREFRFGAAAADITPDYPIRLNGYEARKTESEGVEMKIFTKALAISQDGGSALILSIDNCAISREIRNEIVEKIRQKHQIPSERIVIFTSHTHSAPSLTDAIANMFAMDLPAEQQAKIDRYTRETIERVVEAASTALAKLIPGRLYLARGEVAFAKNRRPKSGPVDHDLPVLIVRRNDGTTGAVLANYASHCTTLQGNRNRIHGDWAGVAQREIQDRNPGAIALISVGCGADSNPHPRGEIEHVERHGRELATEVQRLLSEQSIELTGPIEFRKKEFELPYDQLPSKEEWEQRAAATNAVVAYHAKKNLARIARGETLPTALPYLVQTWNFGNQLAMVFLPGEVVIDYALALKKEFDPRRLWVSGYANWVPCYIPSTRILEEGGYEAEGSLWYYDRPARLSKQTEPLILSAARELIPPSFKDVKQ
jgi:hypothetical protein